MEIPQNPHPVAFEDLHVLVKREVRRLRWWLMAFVRGMDACDVLNDWGSIANEITVLLYYGACRCGRDICATQHSISAWHTSGLTLEQFVFRAVIGTRGLRTGSIVQGMMYPCLKESGSLLEVGKIAFRVCHNPACRHPSKEDAPGHYEGNTCVYCWTDFCPTTTKTIGVERLIAVGEYLPVSFWRCGSKQSREESSTKDERGIDDLTHYYLQHLCRTTDNQVEHGKLGHDTCPWRDCPLPEHERKHPQRATTLWVRRHLAGANIRSNPRPGNLWRAMAEGMNRALQELKPSKRVQVLDLGLPIEVLAETLLIEPRSPLTAKERAKMLVTLRTTLEEYAIDEDMVDEYLYRAAPTPNEREVTQDE